MCMDPDGHNIRLDRAIGPTTLNVGARLFLRSTVYEWPDCDPVNANVHRQFAVFIGKQRLL